MAQERFELELFSRLSEHHVLFCFVLNQHRSRPNKTYAEQKKSQILSSWTKPPFEAPQSSPKVNIMLAGESVSRSPTPE
jgi:hypothetical protein